MEADNQPVLPASRRPMELGRLSLLLLVVAHFTVAPLILRRLEEELSSIIQVPKNDRPRGTKPPRTTTNHNQHDTDPCEGYQGVLRMRSGDEGSAAATTFFVYAVNHLLYAEQHRLLPWFHFDNTSHRIYDDQVHGANPNHHQHGQSSFRMVQGEIPLGENDLPLAPVPPAPGTPLDTIPIHGNGVWESYFLPVSDFQPLHQNQTCWNANATTSTPLYEIELDGVAGGMHLEADWAVRAWVYGRTKPEERTQTIADWYKPMRQKAARMVHKYIRPQPWLLERAHQVNPILTNRQPPQTCLALHVRTTDKAASGGRGEIELDEYWPHVQQFANQHGDDTILYLATDSELTLPHMKRSWPSHIVDKIRTQTNIVRSNESQLPTFDLTSSHHRTNAEVLTDIYAMAQCSQLVHGASSVSEAVLYINPDMHSIDVEFGKDNMTLLDLGWWDKKKKTKKKKKKKKKQT